MNDPLTTYRCGWRVSRRPDDGLFHFPVPVKICRGQWQMMMDSFHFDALPDDAFVDIVERTYRESAFEQLEADLAVLARQVLDEMEQREGLLVVDGVSYDDVKAALYRYTTAERDRQEPTS